MKPEFQVDTKDDTEVQSTPRLDIERANRIADSKITALPEEAYEGGRPGNPLLE
jgi:hypothetical protein